VFLRLYIRTPPHAITIEKTNAILLPAVVQLSVLQFHSCRARVRFPDTWGAVRKFRDACRARIPPFFLHQPVVIAACSNARDDARMHAHGAHVWRKQSGYKLKFLITDSATGFAEI
jgi:hypothetical protein